MMMMERRVLAQTLRSAKPFFLIAGPCVLESEQVVIEIATRCVSLSRSLCFSVAVYITEQLSLTRLFPSCL